MRADKMFSAQARANKPIFYERNGKARSMQEVYEVIVSKHDAVTMIAEVGGKKNLRTSGELTQVATLPTLRSPLSGRRSTRNRSIIWPETRPRRSQCALESRIASRPVGQRDEFPQIPPLPEDNPLELAEATVPIPEGRPGKPAESTPSAVFLEEHVVVAAANPVHAAEPNRGLYP